MVISWGKFRTLVLRKDTNYNDKIQMYIFGIMSYLRFLIAIQKIQKI